MAFFTTQNGNQTLVLGHAFWAVHQGCERLVVISSDTDSIVQLLHSAHSLRVMGSKRYGLILG